MKKSSYTIATLGSHSALQILHGAKLEGFNTLLITTNERKGFYNRFVDHKENLNTGTFKFIDEIVTLSRYSEFANLEKELLKKNIILIPHGSFVAYLGSDRNNELKIPYFGNKKVLEWEGDREKQREWLHYARINVPKQFTELEDVEYPVIVKTYGAAGGKGYFYAKDKQDFLNKVKSLGTKDFIIQEYVIGVTLYIHYFYSPLTKEIEVMSMDRRYETNVDSLGRIPFHGQEGLDIEPSYVVVGNQPLILRESLLPEAYAMGEQVVKASKELMGEKGMFGPFCLETVITPDQRFFVMEISCRIVAGTNIYPMGSPYSWLNYSEPMSTGRRLAREIKFAIEKNKLKEILD